MTRIVLTALVASSCLFVASCHDSESSPVAHTVTITSSNVTIDPAASSTTVTAGQTLSLTVTPATGMTLDAVGGNCPAGSWAGATYTTGAIVADCSLGFSAAPTLPVVTPSGTNLTTTPSTPQPVASGDTLSFTVVADAGYGVARSVAVGGSCPAGAWTNVDSYTTGAITADCTVTFDAVPSTTLGTSVSALALAASGNPRSITITNTGAATAYDVFAYIDAVSPRPPMPAGTALGSSTCGNLAPGASCQFSVFPGAAPTRPPGDLQALPFHLAIFSDNGGTVFVDVDVLVQGSPYQGGYLFSLDDSTPVTGSIGGKVVALTDQADFGAGGLPFSQTSLLIAGIDETSQVPGNTCNGRSDGACNTLQIQAAHSGDALSTYAAGVCAATIEGYSDWYLPAVCEIGYDDDGSAGTGCGNASAPLMDNIRQLFDSGAVTSIGDASTPLWSSTQYAASGQTDAWTSQPRSTVGPHQAPAAKSQSVTVRCVRAVTP